MNNDVDQIKRIVKEYYLLSGDFNGLNINKLIKEVNIDWIDLVPIIRELINDDIINILDDSFDINPFISRFGFGSKDKQIKKLQCKKPPLHLCLYPSAHYLKEVVDKEAFRDKPYQLQLALGAPQLSYKSFDLSVLEFYRNDPRYQYENNDVGGHIYFLGKDLQEKDKVLIETYGFSYNNNLNRAVSVYLRYLSKLTPEHQQLWKLKELSEGYKLHPDYARTTILGEWAEKASICEAFVSELYVINQMATAMERPKLFKVDFGEFGSGRPKEFHFLIRPTLKEFNSFILLFDKLVSENINKKFFKGDVPYTDEEKRNDGKIVVKQKGTLQILDDWIHSKFQFADWSQWKKAIVSFKKLRKMRQQPAHAINEDVFNQIYFQKQREIIMDVYRGVRTLRLVLTNDPMVKNSNIHVPDWLYNGDIWSI